MQARELFDLSGRIALVTGGSRGLGLQIATALGEMGARVAITARKPDALQEAAAHLARLGIEAQTIAADLADLSAIPGLVEQVTGRLGDIDVLVNNAGTTWGAPAESHPADAWRKVMTLNVDAMFFLSQEVARRSLIPRRRGKVINMASIAGLSGGLGMTTVAYNTSKAAIIHCTRTLAAEWGKYNINVNALCPGFFPSKMSRGVLERIEPAILARTPLQRLGGEDDLKGAVVFLASEASRHVTGQYVAVDGGASIA
ncbi:MAG: SDR family oxidoreductase [Steroidobacterales bacterium]